jgi:hypothetical protein
VVLAERSIISIRRWTSRRVLSGMVVGGLVIEDTDRGVELGTRHAQRRSRSP